MLFRVVQSQITEKVTAKILLSIRQSNILRLNRVNQNIKLRVCSFYRKSERQKVPKTNNGFDFQTLRFQKFGFFIQGLGRQVFSLTKEYTRQKVDHCISKPNFAFSFGIFPFWNSAFTKTKKMVLSSNALSTVFTS